MLLAASKEAVSYGANTFMIYTGAPQNTRRKKIEDLNIEAGRAHMKENGIDEIVVHAPYIINIGNTTNPATFELGVDFLRSEIERTAAIGAKQIVLHPGAHVGAGAETGIKKIIEGLNEVIVPGQTCRLRWKQWRAKDQNAEEALKSWPRSLRGLRIMNIYPSALTLATPMTPGMMSPMILTVFLTSLIKSSASIG